MNKPTVTQLTDLLNKPALMKWANKIGLEGLPLDQYRKKSAGAGTSIHNAIEAEFKHGIRFEDPAFRRFIEPYELELSEAKVEGPDYHGRIDVVLRRDGKRFLYDFKSSDRIYFEQKLQLVAYNIIIGADVIGTVNTNHFTETIVTLTEVELNEYTKIIDALVAIWHAKKLLGI